MQSFYIKFVTLKVFHGGERKCYGCGKLKPIPASPQHCIWGRLRQFPPSLVLIAAQRVNYGEVSTLLYICNLCLLSNRGHGAARSWDTHCSRYFPLPQGASVQHLGITQLSFPFSDKSRTVCLPNKFEPLSPPASLQWSVSVIWNPQPVAFVAPSALGKTKPGTILHGGFCCAV